MATGTLISNYGSTVYSISIAQLSDGSVWAVIADSSGDIDVWKNLLTTPAISATSTATAAHGGGSHSLMSVKMVPDSSDNLVIGSAIGSDQTRDVAVSIFNTGTESFGTWTEAIDYDNASPPIPVIDIDIDDSNITHVFTQDLVTYHGTDYDQMTWNSNSGGWSIGNKEVANDTPNVNHEWPHISVDGNDDVHVVYCKGEFGDATQLLTYNKRTSGSWGTEVNGSDSYSMHNVLALRTDNSPVLLGNAGDDSIPLDIYYGTTPSSMSDTAKDSYTFPRQSLLTASNDGSDWHLLVYPSSSTVITVDYRDGSGWTNIDTISTSASATTHPEKHWGNHHTDSHVNIIYAISNSVYWARVSWAAEAERRVFLSSIRVV